MNKYWFCGESAIVDPDFDDEWGDVTLLQHEVDMDGAIPLHPNNNRLNYDPVPLHTRVYDAVTVTELKKREWDRYLKEREYEKQLAEQRAEETHREFLKLFPEPEPPPEPEPSWYEPFIKELLRNMRPEIPLNPGSGRVWRSYIMLAKSDLDWWIKDDPTRGHFPRVWANDTYLIMQFR